MGTNRQHSLIQFLPVFVALLQPPLRPPELSIVPKPTLVPVHHIRAPTDLGTLGQVVAQERHTALWHDTFKGEGKGRVHANALLHAGVQVRQAAHLRPGREWPGEVGGGEFLVQLVEGVRIDQEIEHGRAHEAAD